MASKNISVDTIQEFTSAVGVTIDGVLIKDSKVSYAGIPIGTASNTVAAGDDSRFTNPRTPTAHAASHGSGQADAITISESQVTGLVSDLSNKQDSLGFTPEDSAHKGQASGYCDLDSNGLVPTTRLPSYVDDIIEAASLTALNALSVKETGKIYVALDTNKTYRWSGSAFVYITSGAVDSVAGKTGVVTLASSDVGLGNVSNAAQVTSVTGTAPIASSGGTTPAISISAATTSAAGSMSSSDKTKLDAVTGTNTGDETTATIKTKLGITTLSGSNTGDNAVNTLYSGLVSNATHTGDVTGATALTIASAAVTYAKMQNVSATDKVLGRQTAGAGSVEEIPMTAAGRALIAGVDAAAQRTTLGISSIATLTVGNASGNIPARPAANALSADTVSEITSAAGVTIDGLLVKDGSLKIGDPAISTPVAADVGKLRYYVSGNASYIDVVMQTGASSYSWINLVNFTW